MNLRNIAILGALALPLVADEGMWLFNNFPKDTVKTKYTFDVTDAFLDSLRLGTLRIGAGWGPFVSPPGLVPTSHRIASDCIAKISPAQQDSLKAGFGAATPAAELACPG